MASEATEDEDVVEVPIEGIVYKARRPSVAQGALMAYAQAAQAGDALAVVFKLIKALMGEEALEHIERLVWDRRIDFGDLLGGGTEMNPEIGLVDGIFAEFSERPTQPSTASSSTRATGGRRSTGRSPGKGSTHSPSPSTDS